MASGVDQQQLRRLERRLDRVVESIEIAVTEELMNSSENIVALANQLAPVITGDVRDSIAWEWDGETATVIGTNYPAIGRSGLPIVVELEFGTQTRPAKPFLWPAFKHEEPVFRFTLNERISRELKTIRRYL